MHGLPASTGEPGRLSMQLSANTVSPPTDLKSNGYHTVNFSMHEALFLDFLGFFFSISLFKVQCCTVLNIIFLYLVDIVSSHYLSLLEFL